MKTRSQIFALLTITLLSASCNKIEPYPGMIITESVVFATGTYDFSSGGGIVIAANNITVDGGGAALVGPGTEGDPASYEGIAVAAEGFSNVTLVNVTARGFDLGLSVKDGANWTIDDNDFSYNYTDPDYGWGSGPSYGAIRLERVTGSRISNNTGDHVWNGLNLHESDLNTVVQNHFSPCSNHCLKMWHSSGNVIEHNIMRYGIRVDPGEVHARDSACLLMESGSNDNIFQHNDFTFGGDGVFIRPLNGWVSTGNYFYDNDASYAHNNAWESWSPGNTFENNKANFSSYGFWLGGSDHTLLIDNEAAYNGTVHANAPEDFGNAGISVVNGSSSHFVCSGNNVHDNNGVGIAVRYEAGYEAFHWVIQQNTIRDNTSHGLYLKHARWLDIAGNSFSGNGGDEIRYDVNVMDVFTRSAGPGDLAPTALSTLSASTVYLNDPVVFDASGSTDPNGLTLAYRWDLGDGTISNEAETTHAFIESGFFRIGVTVDNGSLADLAWFDVYVVDDASERGTEGEAGDWSYWSSYGESASFSDDSSERIKGSSSVRMAADSGFPFNWFYPATRDASWDLGTGVNTVEFWIKKENPNTGWQGVNPKVRLGTDTGNYFLYTPTSDQFSAPPYEEARYGWQYFAIPFTGDATWVRSVVGAPSWNDVNYVELTTDTWEAGYTIWIDGLALVEQ